MSIKAPNLLLAFGLVALSLAWSDACSGQVQEYPEHLGQPDSFWNAEVDGDMQFFQPVKDRPLDGIYPRNQGTFATYERIDWHISQPKKTPIGSLNANLVVGSFEVPTYERTYLPSIDAAVDLSGDGWGNRYEVGYFKNGRGIVVTVQTGPEQFFGDQLGREADGSFVDVSIPLEDPFDNLIGYVDGDGDGIPDDANGNDVYGFAGEDVPRNEDGDIDFIDGETDGVIDQSAPVDEGDQFLFPPVFSVVTVRNVTRMNSVELMGIRELFGDTRLGSLDFYFGARFFQIDDNFSVAARDGNVGDLVFSSSTDNNLVGPQVGLRWQNRQGRFALALESRFFAAANIQNMKLDGIVASQAIPGRLNEPFELEPVAFQPHARAVHFSPVGELRISGKFLVTESFALQAGWTGLIAGNIARASNIVGYELPALTIRENQVFDEVFTHGVTFSVVWNRN